MDVDSDYRSPVVSPCLQADLRSLLASRPLRTPSVAQLMGIIRTYIHIDRALAECTICTGVVFMIARHDMYTYSLYPRIPCPNCGAPLTGHSLTPPKKAVSLMPKEMRRVDDLVQKLVSGNRSFLLLDPDPSCRILSPAEAQSTGGSSQLSDRSLGDT